MHVNLSIPALQTAYAEGSSTPTGVLETLYPLLEQEPECFISLASSDALLERCRYESLRDVLCNKYQLSICKRSGCHSKLKHTVLQPMSSERTCRAAPIMICIDCLLRSFASHWKSVMSKGSQ